MGADPHVITSYIDAANSRNPDVLVGPAIRLRSRSLLDVFVGAVLPGGTFAELAAMLAGEAQFPATALAAVHQRRWLAALARTIASHGQPGDYAAALRIYEILGEHSETNELSEEDQIIHAQLMFLEKRYSQLEDTLPKLGGLPAIVSRYLRCDLASPEVPRVENTEREWVNQVNGPLVDVGLDPITLSASANTQFDRLRSASPAGITGGHLVSVVITAFEPDESLMTSVRSVLDQTWGDLEILVIDDASGPGADDILHWCEEADPRVRVLRRAENGGTYVARNLGLAQARGEFVTFQDSDDWSHPQRVDLQVAPLLADAGLLASRSVAVRARPSLTHQWLGYRPHRANASSLLLRKDAVVDRVGYFDSIRKGADFEFAFRLEKATGQKIFDLPEPLAYTRLRAGSLSRTDFAKGWAAPARIAHQSAYRHWHKSIARGGSARLATGSGRRPFPVPASMIEPATEAPRSIAHYDVVLVDDWRPARGPYHAAVDEIRALVSAGLRVGVAHLEAPSELTMKRTYPAAAIQELVNSGVVDRALLTEACRADLVVVRDPAVLQFAPSMEWDVPPKRLVIVVPRAATEYRRLDVAYDSADCEVIASRIFGVRPVWLAASSELAIQSGAAGVLVSPIDMHIWGRERREPRPPLRIGYFDVERSVQRQLAESFGHSPLAAVSRVVHWRPLRAKRRPCGGVGTAAAVWDPADSKGTESLQEFLWPLDVLVCLPRHGLDGGHIDVLARAMAMGVLVVAPTSARSVFAEAASYADPHDVADVVGGLAKERRLARQKIRNGHAYVQAVHSLRSWVNDLRELPGRWSVPSD